MSRPSAVSPPAAGDDTRRLTIDRLRLRAAGLDVGAARRLATLVGEGLAPALQLPAGSTTIETLQVEVAAHTGEAPELLARRIVFNLREGDSVERGQRVGLIKFGSRTDLLLDASARMNVKIGDRVKGGASILAYLQPHGALAASGSVPATERAH